MFVKLITGKGMPVFSLALSLESGSSLHVENTPTTIYTHTKYSALMSL